MTVPNERDAAVLRRNGIDPDEVVVVLSNQTVIICRVYRTGDTIRIDQGERRWPE